MPRRALLAGINDYRDIADLRGCHNDVGNIRHILKTYLGFSNSEIRVVTDERADRDGILYRLDFMAENARPGDYMLFYFAGHGSQVRDRDGDELADQMDEMLCPWDGDWDSGGILDDDLDRIFQKLPGGSLMEVILDCCHSGDETAGRRSTVRSGGAGREGDADRISRYLPPPVDIRFRHEGELDLTLPRRGFQTVNRSGSRSSERHILWAACAAHEEAQDAKIGGQYNGAFTYYFCKHIRQADGNITRRDLLERVRDSLRYENFYQTPQLRCMSEAAGYSPPFQFVRSSAPSRPLYLKTPLMRGEDVRKLQRALGRAGYILDDDGVFGVHTDEAVRNFQQDHNLTPDGVAGQTLFEMLYG